MLFGKKKSLACVSFLPLQLFTKSVREQDCSPTALALSTGLSKYWLSQTMEDQVPKWDLTVLLILVGKGKNLLPLPFLVSPASTW